MRRLYTHLAILSLRVLFPIYRTRHFHRIIRQLRNNIGIFRKTDHHFYTFIRITNQAACDPRFDRVRTVKICIQFDEKHRKSYDVEQNEKRKKKEEQNVL